MTTHAEIIARWNAQADEHNQWDELGEDEKIEWAFACGASAVPARPTRQELEAVLSAMGEEGNPVKPADIPSATDQDTHFFLAGWNCRAAAPNAPLYDPREVAFSAQAAPQAAQGLDAETRRHAAIGKAIERASADLPEETEIIVSLEKDAGTVTLIDQDGNEHENFSTDYGFAGVLNEAIDTALAAQAKQGDAA